MVEFGLLGEVSAEVAGQPLAIGPARQRLVLAALLMDANRVVSVDRLVERVWGVDPPRRARVGLNSYVSRLRQVLGDAELAWRSGGYVLVVDRAAVDVLRFHDLCAQARASTDATQALALFTEALGLWRGTALTGLEGPWAAAERNRLHQQRRHAEHDLIDARLRAGHGADLVAELSSRTTEHPLDERAAGQYMLALYRAGRAADALEHYQQIRSRLADGLGTDPGPSLQELHQRILRADTALTGQSSPRPVGTGTSAMHSLRGDIATFTGRGEETARLLEALDTGDVRAVAIHTVDGMAGVGKTTFAVHIAHQLTERFPDGQLFIELHGHTPGLRPVPADEALASLLLATGLPAEALPTSVDDRARLWRDRVAGKRVLVVLDDAADHDQVRPLLPATAGSLVMITSRHRLPALDSVVPVTLTALPADQATMMLCRLARIGPGHHDREANNAIVELCGRLPLAIALAAGQLRSHPTWTPRHLADQLAEIDARLETLAAGDRSVSVAFDMSFNALPRHQQRLLRLLGAHPGPEVDAYAVAALLDSSLAEARRGLAGLHADHLVEEASPGRFRMHDLVRTYAQHRAAELDQRDRDDALARALRYYVHTTIVATDSLEARRQVPVAVPAAPRHSPVLVDHAAAWDWLVRELPTLCACVERAAGNGHEAMAFDLAAAAQMFLRRYNQYHRARAMHETALAAAIRVGDRLAEANSHYMLGCVGRMFMEFDASTNHLADAVDRYRELGDRNGQAYALHEMGLVAGMPGDYVRAMPLFTEALDLFLSMDDRGAQALAMKHLGVCHYWLGRYDVATSMLTEARETLVALDGWMELPDVLRYLAAIHRQRGEFHDAYATATLSLRTAEEAGDRMIMALAGVELGVAQRNLGEYAAATATLTRVEEGPVTAHLRPLLAMAWRALGTVHRALGQYATAARFLMDALAEEREVGMPDEEVDTLLELGTLAFEYPEAGDPADHYRLALRIARDIDLVVQEARALAGLGRCLHRAGDPEAMKFLRQALDIYEPMGLPEALLVAELVKAVE